MAWPFFYQEHAPEEVGVDKVPFEITEHASFAMIPENEIDANDEAIQG